MKGEDSTASRKLDWAERWIRDGLELSKPPAFFETLQVDMTEASALIEQAREQGLRLTYAAILVRAAAVALAANPDLHVMVCGSRMYSPRRVDLAVSIASEGSLAPVMVLESANLKMLPQLAAELAGRVEEVRAADAKLMGALRRWGWVLPFAILRKTVLRSLHRSREFQRKSAGTFQVSIVPGVDQFVTPVFGGSAVLTAGRVAERVVAVKGVPLVRPTVYLACSADHRVWNGGAAERFLRSLQDILEGPELGKEALNF
ncbi:MAG TPA: 2-oxo acid dehydrogenase subunit E2 [Bryobacteraceae bacterium]|jgi:pyruvate/2-oxoglutarate dehydrogenase complex dihydrolipoamide acyltransferase (E2) component|nr:2-oxo acid dehydrogenase subunit E2 [Bryobacteraceae bacterium]